jgi:hypothetical protein
MTATQQSHVRQGQSSSFVFSSIHGLFQLLFIKDTRTQRLGMLMTYKPKYRGRQWLRYCTGSFYTLSEVMKVVILPYSRKDIRTQYQSNKTQDRNFLSLSTTRSRVYRRLMTSYVCACVCVGGWVCGCGCVCVCVCVCVWVCVCIPHFS